MDPVQVGAPYQSGAVTYIDSGFSFVIERSDNMLDLFARISRLRQAPSDPDGAGETMASPTIEPSFAPRQRQRRAMRLAGHRSELG
jgi:hypothetical protein